MYYLKSKSLLTDTPVYQKLDGEDSFFFPEHRVAKDYAATGPYEQPIIDWACNSLVPAGKDVIDIGAHCGIYTVALAKKVNRVYSFECSPKTFNYLCANIALRGLDYRVTKYNVALGSSEGTTSYYIRDPNDGGGNGICRFDYDEKRQTESIEVPVRTLDSFGLKNIGFIKIDVEGAEQQVLEGAVETLKANGYPKILFESWRPAQEALGFPAAALRESLFAFIQSLGYRIIPVHGWDEMFVAERV